MAQIEQGGGDDKKKKGAQKKMHIHVDFTPMVDMNMLLITFFMLCTTMLKSQTLNIILPTNEQVVKENQNKAKQSEAFTIIVDSERADAVDGVPGKILGNYVYYYEGVAGGPEGIGADNVIKENNLKEPETGNGTVNAGVVDQIRDVLRQKNKEVVSKLDELDKEWQASEAGTGKKMTPEEYQRRAKEIISSKDIKNKPVVIIKATPQASFENLVSALDEMQINGINTFQIDNLNKQDSLLLADYLAKHPRKK